MNILNTMMTQNAVFDFKVLNITVDRNDPFPDIVDNIGTLTKTTGFINYSNNAGEHVMIGYLYPSKNYGALICLSYNYNVARVYTLNNSVYSKSSLLDYYSTSEMVVGTWVDGKTIYRKTAYISSLPNATSQTYNYSTYSITPTRLIDAQGIAYNSSNGATFIINGARESLDASIGLRSTISSSTKTFTIQTGQDRRSFEAYITFWYLKD